MKPSPPGAVVLGNVVLGNVVLGNVVLGNVVRGAVVQGNQHSKSQSRRPLMSAVEASRFWRRRKRSKGLLLLPWQPTDRQIALRVVTD
jgi:hypothetical protein